MLSIIYLQRHCLLLHDIVPNAIAQSKYNLPKQSSVDYTGVLSWKGLPQQSPFEFHILRFHSGLGESVRGRNRDVSRAAAFASCSRASTQQIKGTEKHIGEVWCLLSHLGNTLSCTRLEKIDINSRIGRDKGETVRCTVMRKYPCFSHFKCSMFIP